MNYPMDTDPIMQTIRQDLAGQLRRQQSHGCLPGFFQRVLEVIHHRSETERDDPWHRETVARCMVGSGVLPSIVDAAFSSNQNGAPRTGTPLSMERQQELASMKEQLSSGMGEIVIDPQH